MPKMLSMYTRKKPDQFLIIQDIWKLLRGGACPHLKHRVSEGSIVKVVNVFHHGPERLIELELEGLPADHGCKSTHINFSSSSSQFELGLEPYENSSIIEEFNLFVGQPVICWSGAILMCVGIVEKRNSCFYNLMHRDGSVTTTLERLDIYEG